MPIESLKPYERNARIHPEHQIEKLCSSIIEFGFNSPILVSSDQGIIAGHGRLMAAKKLGLLEVPVVILDHLSDAQRRAYILADNRIGMDAGWDREILQQEIAALGELDFDVSLAGFSDAELERISDDLFPIVGDGPQDDFDDPDFGSKGPYNKELDPRADETPEPLPDPKVVRGEVYILGDHRLMCGDSTSVDDYTKLMNGEKPLLMVTDPPYGVEYDATWREEALGDKLMGKPRTGKVAHDDRADWYDVWAICNADIAYVWHASAFSDVVMDSLRRAAFDVRQQIIWNKSVLIMGRSAYHWKHEPCWYAVRKGCHANWKGDRKQTTVWDAAHPTHIMSGSKEERTAHPTQKPVLVYEVPIENHTSRGDLLFEPFSGSGTAFIACEKLRRRVYGMEFDPKYVALILDRWQNYTGKKAIRESDGKLWDEIKGD